MSQAVVERSPPAGGTFGVSSRGAERSLDPVVSRHPVQFKGSAEDTLQASVCVCVSERVCANVSVRVCVCWRLLNPWPCIAGCGKSLPEQFDEAEPQTLKLCGDAAGQTRRCSFLLPSAEFKHIVIGLLHVILCSCYQVSVVINDFGENSISSFCINTK